MAFLVSKDNTRVTLGSVFCCTFSLFPLLIHPKQIMRKRVKLELTFSWKTLRSGLLPVCFRLPPHRLCCVGRRNGTPHPMPETAECQTAADKTQTTPTAKVLPQFWGRSFRFIQHESHTFVGRRWLLCPWRHHGDTIHNAKGWPMWTPVKPKLVSVHVTENAVPRPDQKTVYLWV